MKKILTILVLFLTVSSCFASEKFNLNHIIKINQKCGNECVMAQRGCCSHHGGVGGCSHGRTLCNDGTLSPSCRCLKDDIQINNNKIYNGYSL